MPKRTPIEWEQDTMRKMIRLFCRKYHGSGTGLCNDCRDLLGYTYKRLEKCKFGNNKPNCKKCSVYCYKPEMREKIRKVMCCIGPLMIFYHPVDAIQHTWKSIKPRK